MAHMSRKKVVMCLSVGFPEHATRHPQSHHCTGISGGTGPHKFPKMLFRSVFYSHGLLVPENPYFIVFVYLLRLRPGRDVLIYGRLEEQPEQTTHRNWCVVKFTSVYCISLDQHCKYVPYSACEALSLPSHLSVLSSRNCVVFYGSCMLHMCASFLLGLNLLAEIALILIRSNALSMKRASR